MRCGGCGSESPPGARFCMHCGQGLPRTCAGCGDPIHPGLASCVRCGDAPSAVEEAPAGPASDAERRQLSVLFCDLVGSTVLAESLGAESYREVVRAYQQVAGPMIDRFGGYVAQYLGDGLLAYFGYPHASEDDAERAVHAGLAILEGLKVPREALRAQYGIALDVRLALHTGRVVIGEVGAGMRREMLALGDSANLAARLQEKAPTNGLLISEATLRLVRGLFVTEPFGSVALRGLSRPVGIHRVQGRTRTRTRMEAIRPDHLTPLVGRTQEVELLLDRWERAQAGHGQVVVISGEPGIGKSRLVRALRESLTETPHTWLEYRCAFATRHSAFHPVVDLLRRELEAAGGSPEAVASPETLERLLRERGLPPDVLPLFAELLSLPFPSDTLPAQLAASRRRARTLEALVDWTRALARGQPVVLHVDDLHWIDPSTWELLQRLVDLVPRTCMLIAVTRRPETGAARPEIWESCAYVTPVWLNRLTRPQSLAMIEQLQGGTLIPAELAHEIVQRTDGVPLFLEELVRSLAEGGAFDEPASARGRAREIPSTLADSLMARLDRLGRAKQIAQVCAVLGRSFPRRLIEATWDGPRTQLERGLERLVASDLLQIEGSEPRVDYAFRHALIQEAAYASLLRSPRAQLHARAADQIERELADLAQEQPERVAHHRTEAGQIELAVEAWERAGVRATERSAPAEAIQHFDRALALIQHLPDGPAHVERELRLQVARSVPLQAVCGHTSPEVEQAFARARELAERVGDSAGLFPVVAGLSALYLVRGRVQLGRDLALQALRLAERSGDPWLRVWAHYSLGITQLYLGEFEAARESTQAGIALAGDRQPGALGARYAGDPVIDCHVVAAQALWMLGRVREARRAEQSALALAERLGQPLSRAYVSLQSSILRYVAREPEEARAWAQRTQQICEQGGFTLFGGVSACIEGWATAVTGGPEEGIRALLRGFRSLRDEGTDLIPIPMSAALAEAYLAAGRLSDARSLLHEALRAADSLEVRITEPELRRLAARCHLRLDPVDLAGAEERLRAALDLAQKQAAAPMVLRIALDLSELLEQTGRAREAEPLLSRAVERIDDPSEPHVQAACRTLARLRAP